MQYIYTIYKYIFAQDGDLANKSLNLSLEETEEETANPKRRKKGSGKEEDKRTVYNRKKKPKWNMY